MTEEVTKAIKAINDLSDLPWVDANERWGAEGIDNSDACLLYDREKITRTRRNRKTGKDKQFTKWTGGYKDWGWDFKQSWRHLLKGLRLKRNSSLDDMLGGRHFSMAWYYLRHSNNLNRPDGKVSGTNLYGVWVEEAWHAAIWSPVVALAVRDLLESRPEDPKAIEVARLINIQRERLSKREKEDK